MRKFLFLAAVAVAAGVARAQSGGAADHGKVMGCYWGSWSFYRCRLISSLLPPRRKSIQPWSSCASIIDII